MLQLHGQRLRPERRQRRLTEPHLFYRTGEQSRQTYASFAKSGRRRRSDRTNGITANISGKKYYFTTRLLSRYPQSLLAHKHKRKYFYDCIRDEYFFDRNRTAFESIFTFYDSRGELVLPRENFPEHLLADEFYFFGLYEDINEYDKTNNLVLPSALKKKEIAPRRKCQKEVWKICEIPDSSALARLMNLFSLLVIISSAVILFVDTLPGIQRSETVTLLSNLISPTPAKNSSDEQIWRKSAPERLQVISAVESFCIAWFSFELITRFFVSPQKKRFFLRALNVIDLIAIVPFYVSLVISMRTFGTSLYIMRILRLSRIFRVIKISRYVSTMKVLGKTVKASVKDLWTMCFLILIGTVLFGSTAYYCEQWDAETSFNSIPISCWWALVTITTLGYGDLVPTTLGGKIAGSVCSVSGVLLITPFLPIIFNKFSRFQELEKELKLKLGNDKGYQSDIRLQTQYEVNQDFLKKRRRRFTM